MIYFLKTTNTYERDTHMKKPLTFLFALIIVLSITFGSFAHINLNNDDFILSYPGVWEHKTDYGRRILLLIGYDPGQDILGKWSE